MQIPRRHLRHGRQAHRARHGRNRVGQRLVRQLDTRRGGVALRAQIANGGHRQRGRWQRLVLGHAGDERHAHHRPDVVCGEGDQGHQRSQPASRVPHRWNLEIAFRIPRTRDGHQSRQAFGRGERLLLPRRKKGRGVDEAGDSAKRVSSSHVGDLKSAFDRSARGVRADRPNGQRIHLVSRGGWHAVCHSDFRSRVIPYPKKLLLRAGSSSAGQTDTPSASVRCPSKAPSRPPTAPCTDRATTWRPRPTP